MLSKWPNVKVPELVLMCLNCQNKRNMGNTNEKKMRQIKRFSDYLLLSTHDVEYNIVSINVGKTNA